MKTVEKTWAEYLNTWPTGWYMDDVEIIVNGVSEDDKARKDTDIIEIRGGFIIHETDRDFQPKSLTRHFEAWLKKQTRRRGMFEYPASAEQQVVDFMRSINGKQL